jgi:hypothetical protein
VLIR